MLSLIGVLGEGHPLPLEVEGPTTPVRMCLKVFPSILGSYLSAAPIEGCLERHVALCHRLFQTWGVAFHQSQT